MNDNGTNLLLWMKVVSRKLVARLLFHRPGFGAGGVGAARYRRHVNHLEVLLSTHTDSVEERLSVLERRVEAEAELRAKVDEDLSKVEGGTKAALTLIEAVGLTQGEHSHKFVEQGLILGLLSDVQGRHTTTLNGQTHLMHEQGRVLSSQTDLLDLHTDLLKAQTELLRHHSTQLNAQGDLLKRQSSQLDSHTEQLRRQGAQLDEHTDLLKQHSAQLTGLSAQLTGLKEEVSGLDQRVSGLDQKVTGLDQKVTGLQVEVSGLGTKMDRVLALLTPPATGGCAAQN